MEQVPTLFLVTFTTLPAMINPLESITVFLNSWKVKTRKSTARWPGVPVCMHYS